MPFTPSHAAFVLPLRRYPFPPAIVIGSFSPDFEYFLRRSTASRYGHTLPGVFLLTLPCAVVILWLFEMLVKPLCLGLLPDSLQRRIAPAPLVLRRQAPMLLAYLVSGIATHIAWDFFTHPGPLPIYRPLQHLSTLVGAAALTLAFRRWWLTTPPSAGVNSHPHRRTILAALCALTLCGSLIRAPTHTGVPFDADALRSFSSDLATASVPLLWWQLLALSLSRLRRTDSEPAPGY